MTWRFVSASVQDGRASGVVTSSAYLSALATTLSGYWAAQSGGREVITWNSSLTVTVTVVTPADFWSQYQTDANKVSDHVRDEVLATTALAPGECLAIVLHGAPPGLAPGVTGQGGFPLVLAESLSASSMAHEMGHFFQRRSTGSAHGSYHANTLPTLWVAEYADRCCVMGSEGNGGSAKYTFHDPALTPTMPTPVGVSANFDLAGPGMCPPMVDLTGWLDTTLTSAVVDISGVTSQTETLGRWTGAPAAGAGWPPVLLVADGLAPSGDRIYLSTRHRSGWDLGFPPAFDIGSTTTVWAHELLPSHGSVRLARLPALVGAYARLGRAPLSVSVVEAGGDAVQLHLERDPWRGEHTVAGASFDPAARVAAVSRLGTVEAFVIGLDGLVRTVLLRDGAWSSNWGVLDGVTFSQTAGIAAVSRTPETVDLFVVGPDDLIRARYYHDGAWEPGWEVVDGGDLDQASGLAAARVGDDSVALVVSAADGRVLRCTVTNRVRSSWREPEETFQPAAAVAALARGDGRPQVHAVRRGPADARLWSLPTTAPEWGGWMPHLGLEFPDDRAVGATAMAGDGQLVAVAGDPMFVRVYDGIGWVDERVRASGSSPTGGIAAASPDGENVVVLSIGADRMLHAHWRSPKPEFIPPAHQIANEFDVMLLSADGHVVTAEGGGGGAIRADRTALGPWERFRMLVLDHVEEHGEDKVVFALRASGGHLVCAELGGGRELLANRIAIGDWEKFRLVATQGGPEGPAWIGSVQTFDGSWWCADRGGGSWVSADRSARGPWEQFSIARIGP